MPSQVSESSQANELLSKTRELPCGKLTVTSVALPCGGAEVIFKASTIEDTAGLTLHWAVGTKDAPGDWTLAPEGARPTGSTVFADGKACRSPLGADGVLKISFSAADIGVKAGGAVDEVDDSDEEEDVVEDAADDEDEGVVPLQQVLGIMVRSVDGREDDWLHAADGAGDLIAPLCAPPPPPPPGKGGVTLARKAAADEGAGGMNLFRRFCMVNDAFSAAVAMDGPDGAAVLLAWLRLSANRVLPWYEGHNYQGKDMAHVQKALASSMAVAAASGGEKGLCCRLALAVLPRGGGDGDAIRMGILNLMRSNGIKEGHRPGIEDAFIAQWHQKLHSNTTRDDIAIGEAYLHFLHGPGNWDDFWWHLWEHNKLTKEDLAAMKAGWRTNGITGPANHMPHLIPAFQHLLWIIKITHSGADLDDATTMARGKIGDDVQWDVDDLLRNRDEWWVPGKIVSIRQRMEPCWRHPESRAPDETRSVLLLDVALESFFRTKLEGMDLRTMSRDDRASVLEIALDGGVIAAESQELGAGLASWKRLLHDSGSLERWSPEWALAADAALEYIALAVSHVLDRLGKLVQTPADMFGKAVKADKSRTVNFGEEVVRGHALFPVSAILSSLQPEVRSLAGLSPWQVISLGQSPAGKVVVRSLSDMQGEDVSAEGVAQIVLSSEVGGLEDVPRGVVAVLTKTPIDLLSHIAIRARNTGVMLASCADAGKWAELEAFADSFAKLSFDATSGAVIASEATASDASLPGTKSSAAKTAASEVSLVKPKPSTAWTILPSEYDSTSVGGKAMSLAKLGDETKTLGDLVSVPLSYALPFGSFEKALKLDVEGGAVLSERLSLLAGADKKDPKATRKALKAVRKAVMGINIPADLKTEMGDVGSSVTGSEVGEGEETAVKSVWASKWTSRAYLSRQAVGISESDLYMGVLCMKLVAAEYAFVLHTADPISGSSDVVFGEVVVGLGETLVGNSPGRAMSFSASKSTPSDFKIHSLPSKIHGHFAPDGGTMIARSDSNGEDLEDFAGAGLYDSVCAKPTKLLHVAYAGEKLMWDSAFRADLVKTLVDVAKSVEQVANAAQDIEGCIVGDRVYLVQSRAQI